MKSTTILPPRGVKDISSLSARRQAEIAFAATSYQYHWTHARLASGPYRPSGAPCIFCPNSKSPRPTCFNCKGTGVLIHRKQLDFHNSPFIIIGFIGGLGSGKTSSGAAESVKQAISQPGCTGIVAAPTYKQLASSTKELLFSILHPDAIHKYDKTDEHVILTNGSHIWFRSTEDPEPIRGINATWFWLDEGAESTEGAWNILMGRIREPGFIHRAWLTTTPKGMNWVYTYFASPEKRPDYALINSTSMDNPYIEESYIRRQRATLPPRYFEEEMLGKFMGFDGLCYPDFSKDTHIIPRESIPKLKEVIYGHDWGYDHPATIVAIGFDDQDRAYILDEWKERGAVISDILAETRNMEAKYGSGPHVCDTAGAQNIEEMGRNGFHVVAADKGAGSVPEGIAWVAGRMMVQSDGKPRFFVADHCQKLINEIGRYQWEPQRDGKSLQRERPLKLNDDLCFTAGTRISTSTGPVPIEEMRAGMLVHTRNGLRRVRFSGMTSRASEIYRATFSDGTVLDGTGNHPVWVYGKGFIPLDALRYGHTCAKEQWAHPKSHTTAALDSPDTQRENTRRIADISPVSLADMSNVFSTGPSTMTPSGQSRAAWMSTMSMGTTTTTTRQTLNFYPSQTISKNIGLNGGSAQKRWHKSANTSRTSDLSPLHGTRLRKELNFTVNLDVILPPTESQSPTSVNSVVGTSSLLYPGVDFAQTPASQHGEETPDWTMSQRLASAANSSESANTVTSNPVPRFVQVVSVEKTGRHEPVYNLTVAETHEFYANGILVHNCDAVRYSLIYYDRHQGGSFSIIDATGFYDSIVGRPDSDPYSPNNPWSP